MRRCGHQAVSLKRLALLRLPIQTITDLRLCANPQIRFYGYTDLWGSGFTLLRIYGKPQMRFSGFTQSRRSANP
jgi:hypothetical protein